MITPKQFSTIAAAAQAAVEPGVSPSLDLHDAELCALGALAERYPSSFITPFAPWRFHGDLTKAKRHAAILKEATGRSGVMYRAAVAKLAEIDGIAKP
jgi:hypothetical protein